MESKKDRGTEPNDRKQLAAEIRIDAYKVISRAVEDGANIGFKKAFKYDDKPSYEALKDSIEDHIMMELCEVLRFGPDDEVP